MEECVMEENPGPYIPKEDQQDGHVQNKEFMVFEQHVSYMSDPAAVDDITYDINSNAQPHLNVETFMSCTKELHGNVDSEKAKGEVNIMGYKDWIQDTQVTAEENVLPCCWRSLGSKPESLFGQDVEHENTLSSSINCAFVPIQIKAEPLSSEDSSYDSDTDSDTSSSSSPATTSTTTASSVSLTALLLDGDEDDDLTGRDGKGFPVTPKEVLHLNELPAVEDLNITLPNDVEVKPCGVVTSTVDQLVIFESRFNQHVLGEGTIIFNEDKLPVGKIFEIFGPIPRPSYVLRFNSAQHIAEHGIKVNDIMYFVPDSEEFSKYLETEKLRHGKGSDASWKNDEEPPPDFLDFSDDEKEKEARKLKKEGWKKIKAEKNETGHFEVDGMRYRQQASSPSQATHNSSGFTQKKFPQNSQREFRQPRNSNDPQQNSDSQWTSSEVFPSNTWQQEPYTFSAYYRQQNPVKQEPNPIPGHVYYPDCEAMWQYPPPQMSWQENNMPHTYNQQYSMPPPPPPPLHPPPSSSAPPQYLHSLPFSSMPPPPCPPLQSSYIHQFSSVPPPPPPNVPSLQFTSMPPPSPQPPSHISSSPSHNTSFPSLPQLFPSMPPESAHQLPPLHSLAYSLMLPPPPPPPYPPPDDVHSPSC